jgi:hypothetical protein
MGDVNYGLNKPPFFLGGVKEEMNLQNCEADVSSYPYND